ncbi:hypothetical protein RN001_001903 [Aquatica leii]|uniref:DUF4806 domain-containing protein n=1 Tax=Aquatica leii TaxID=1421715 RepID=A0AAN7SJU1_9COLE|nr:hypothetical protein RN001_001903 [Aquatica leii]
MAQSWDLIIWTNENSPDVVPSSWAINEDRSLYVWPVNVKKSKILSMISNCIPPSSKHNYEELPAKHKKTITSLQRAEKYLKRLEVTSSVETENNDEENNAVCTTAGIIQHCSQRQVARNALHHQDTDEVLSNPQLQTPSDPQHRDTNEKICQIENQLKKLYEFMVGLELHVIEIKNDIKTMKNFIDRSTPILQDYPANEKWNLPLPITSLNEFEEGENLLPNLQTDLVKMLSLVGGNTFRHTISNMIKKLLSRDVALRFSGTGKKGKKNFSDSKYFPVLTEAARKINPLATDQEIKKLVGLILAGAGDWNGNYSRKKTNEQLSVDNIVEL